MSTQFQGSGYYRINTSEVPIVTTAIPQDQLCDMVLAAKVRDAMTALYGKNCSLVSALAPGEIQMPAGPLVYEAISIPGYAEGTSINRAPINCQSLILAAQTPTGKLGAWGLDPNGGPEWKLADVPVVPLPPGQGGWGPPASYTATSVMNFLLVNWPWPIKPWQ